jgi:hypothetical protein
MLAFVGGASSSGAKKQQKLREVCPRTMFELASAHKNLPQLLLLSQFPDMLGTGIGHAP